MQDQEPWKECPSGVVTDMAGQLRRRSRQAQLRPFVVVGAAVLLLFAISYGLVNSGDPSAGGVLDCREASSLFAQYHDKTLDAVARMEVEEHLSRCPQCRKHYEQRYPGPNEARSRSSADTRWLAMAAKLPH